MKTIPGFKMLLMGETGRGKTHSLRTLVDAGITPFVIFTEQGMDVLGDIPPEKCHWKYIAPAKVPWGDLAQAAQTINRLSFKALKSLTDSKRHEYDQMVQLWNTCNNFICDRTGEEFGDVSTWGTDRCLVLDSFTGAGTMALKLVVGNAPSPDQGQWGVAMQQLHDLVIQLCNQPTCHVVVISHIGTEYNEAAGQTTRMISTLGQKLAPKIGLNFSDVIEAYRNGDKFRWRTTHPDTATKAHNVPWGTDINPDFRNVISAWGKRGGKVLSMDAMK